MSDSDEGWTVAESRTGGAPVDELQRRIAQLTEAVLARDNFLAVAAHELRNPMTPILGHVQRLHRLVRSRACSLGEVEQGLARIELLIELYLKRATTLLDVSRITTGKLKLETEPVDVSELVRHVAASHEAAAQYARVPLHLRIQGGIVASCNRLALEQILDNLLLNAVKYGAGKPVEVVLDGDDQMFRLTVRDHGIGISSEAQARIFERFERAVATGTQGGFGVGLWVVGQLVDAMGGHVAVDSVADNGSTFVVTLPRACVQQA